MRDGAATDAGASAVISIANPIAMLRQLETSNITTVRILVAVRGMLGSLMTSMGEPPAWGRGTTAVGHYQLRQRRPRVRDVI
jgi:hypothetical protein